MTDDDLKDASKTWWQSIIFRANRWYALAILCAMAVAAVMPLILGYFVQCAEFMEVEWTMVGFLCVGGLGLMNVLFSFAPTLESVVPKSVAAAIRVSLLFILPTLVLFGAMWLAFFPFWYALMNDPVLLCD